MRPPGSLGTDLVESESRTVQTGERHFLGQSFGTRSLKWPLFSRDAEETETKAVNTGVEEKETNTANRQA